MPSLLGQLYLATHGPLNAIPMIGAAMAIVGLAILVRELRHRQVRPSPAAAHVAGGQPIPS